MKQITITFLLLVTTLLAFSQTKFIGGVYAEGGLFFPKSGSSSQDIENKLAGGGGVFISYNITPKFAASLQAGYRYKSNNATSRIYGEDGFWGYGDEDPMYENIHRNYKQHYFVLPIKINYLLTEKLFIEAGIETAWILNYGNVKADQLSNDANAPYHNSVNEKPEFDWIVGCGYNLSPKLKASVNYTQGFKEQGMGSIKSLDDSFGQLYRNRMLMLNLSYSIFDLKK